MPKVPGRPLTKLDACLMAVALGLGSAWAWTLWPSVFDIYCGGFSRRALSLNQNLRTFRLILHLASTTLAPLTLVVALLPWLGPKATRRSSFRTPGIIACIAASAVLLAEVANYPVRQVTLYGELTRVQGDARNNIVQYPRPDPYWRPNELSYRAMAGSVAFEVGPHAGLAVLGVWFAFCAARISTTRSGPLDRLGRILSSFWVASAIGFLLTPVS